MLYCKILVIVFLFAGLNPRMNSSGGSVLSIATRWDLKYYPGRNTGLVRKSKLKGISTGIWLTSMVNLTKNALLAMSFVLLAGDISPNPGPSDVLKASGAGNGISFCQWNIQCLTDAKFEEISSWLGAQDNRNRADVVILTETFLANKKPNLIYNIPDYDL